MRIKKSFVSLVVILLLSSTILVLADDEADIVYNSKTIDLNLKISSSVLLLPYGTSPYITFIEASLSYYPKNDSLQKVISLETSPQAEKKEGNLVFRWASPKENEISFLADSYLKITNKLVHFEDKIHFPLRDIPDDIIIYTMPSDNIDSDNNEVVNKASEIVAGTGDLFVATYELAWWTKNNINYDLSTLTAETSQKSSWVLEKRYGVCDELTNLFIGMCRAVGIPARFVSGISYTNSDLFTERWGPHGWAEVYFPEKGWVPFDVTYGQFGYADASHIKLKTSVDSNESSTIYEWSARNYNVETSPLDFETTLLSSEGKVKDLFDFEVSILKDEVGFGSYNLVEVDVNNPTDYYLPVQLFISRSEGVTNLNGDSQEILLLPKESKKLFWKLKVDEDLNSKYKYTIFVDVYTQRNNSKKLSFTSEKSGVIYSLEEIEEYIENTKEPDKKVFWKDADISCRPTKDYFYENPSVQCDIVNVGNTLLKGISVCLDKNCKEITLGIGKTEVVSLNFSSTETGEFEKKVYMNHPYFLKSDDIIIKIYDEPAVNLSISYPKIVKFDEKISVNFSVTPTSYSRPKDVSISMKKGNTEKVWGMGYMNRTHKYIVDLDTSDFSRETRFDIIILFHDETGKEFEYKENFSILLDELTLSQKVEVSFKDVLRFIDEHLLLSMTMVAVIILLMILTVLWSRGKSSYLDDYEKKVNSESEDKFYKEVDEDEKLDEDLFG